jgi:hypothetical protein
VTVLRFHRSVYAGRSVDEAVKRFNGFAAFELTEEPEHWVVQLTAADAARERLVAGELGNFALGLTIQTRGVRP